MDSSAETGIASVEYKILPVEDYFGLITEFKSLSGIQDIPMGKVSPDPLKPAVTFGANPCIAGATFSANSDGIYVFHSTDNVLPEELMALIAQKMVTGGIVGGSFPTYRQEQNARLFEQIGARFIPAPDDDFQASFAVGANPEKRILQYAYNLRKSRLR